MPSRVQVAGVGERDDEPVPWTERIPGVDVGRVASAPRGGPTVVAGTALGTLAVSVWNFKRQLPAGTLGLGPVLAAALGISLSLLLLSLAVRIVRSDLPPRKRWLVAGGTVGGGVLAGALIFLTAAIRLADGQPVGDPLFVLVMNTAAGAIAGTLVGVLYARESRQAARASRARSHLAFINGVISHDVRNGLAVIRARAELLQGDPTPESRVDESVEAILEQGETLEGLVDRTHATIAALEEDGGITLSPVDLRGTLEPRLESIDASFPAARILTDLPADVSVRANDLLVDVVGNLVTNGIEHNDREEPTVRVSATVTDGRVRLRVADDGPGIPAAVRDALTEGGGRTDPETGGFGLFFVRAMVAEYGGHIRVEDNQPRGSVVVLDLERA